MKVIQILGKECNNIWCKDMGIRGEKGIRKDHDGFLRWTYNLDFCTPRYIVRRELGIEKVKNKMGNKSQKICRKNKRNGRRKMGENMLGREKK